MRFIRWQDERRAKSIHIVINKSRSIYIIMKKNKNTKTKVESQERELMKDIIHKLMNHKLADQFKAPVDWQTLGLFDYPSLITHPMDLTTVDKKLKTYQYRLVEDFLKDIELIWSNCITYNTEAHWLSSFAIKLRKQTHRFAKNYFPHVIISPEKDDQPFSEQEEILNIKKDKVKKNSLEKKQIDVATIKSQSHKTTSSNTSKTNQTARSINSSYEDQLRELLLDKIDQESDQHVGMLFLTMKRRCPQAAMNQSDGDLKIDLRLLDMQTVQRSLIQIQRWNNDQ